jgi:hypothetical protein
MSRNSLFIYLVGGAACLAYLFSMAYQRRKHGYADQRVAYRFAQGAIVTFLVMLLISALWNLAAASLAGHS